MNVDPMDPEVRAAVFATVTQTEAMRIMRSRAGKPWNQAMTEIILEGLKPLDYDGDALEYVRGVNLADAAQAESGRSQIAGAGR